VQLRKRTKNNVASVYSEDISKQIHHSTRDSFSTRLFRLEQSLPANRRLGVEGQLICWSGLPPFVVFRNVDGRTRRRASTTTVGVNQRSKEAVTLMLLGALMFEVSQTWFPLVEEGVQQKKSRSDCNIVEAPADGLSESRSFSDGWWRSIW
jgi:hypothetical protein